MDLTVVFYKLHSKYGAYYATLLAGIILLMWRMVEVATIGFVRTIQPIVGFILRLSDR